uniref:Uncharacterized protein n=1 Tax=Chromera velia CCMP2878 TaxID=1169474 RepID=A0A0G4F1J3_9ALVE|eukprot:Cvel_14567.t1-p1 / transcript=Cvel_14567.t1 / gene=Cvel_14567 / organism=Chromera_velia_CCMP2878 / gene_product=hypothetical protein / transcript_product=hypothetical protein / location=Cvel_scaffold1041:22972-24615(-) / protein_length=345 / sequence_SO=supercontig / SO=protein_coding / is_pseudo=false
MSSTARLEYVLDPWAVRIPATSRALWRMIEELQRLGVLLFSDYSFSEGCCFEWRQKDPLSLVFLHLGTLRSFLLQLLHDRMAVICPVEGKWRLKCSATWNLLTPGVTLQGKDPGNDRGTGGVDCSVKKEKKRRKRRVFRPLCPQSLQDIIVKVPAKGWEKRDFVVQADRVGAGSGVGALAYHLWLRVLLGRRKRSEKLLRELMVDRRDLIAAVRQKVANADVEFFRRLFIRNVRSLCQVKGWSLPEVWFSVPAFDFRMPNVLFAPVLRTVRHCLSKFFSSLALPFALRLRVRTARPPTLLGLLSNEKEASLATTEKDAEFDPLRKDNCACKELIRQFNLAYCEGQ